MSKKTDWEHCFAALHALEKNSCGGKEFLLFCYIKLMLRHIKYITSSMTYIAKFFFLSERLILKWFKWEGSATSGKSPGLVIKWENFEFISIIY